MKKVVSTVIVLLILAVLGAAVAGVLVDNSTSQNIEKEISAIKLPDSTTIDASISRTGKLTVKNGALQFYGAVLLKSGEPIGLIQSHYKNEYKGDLELKVIPLAQARAEFGDDFDPELRFSHHEGAPDGYYIAYAFANGQDPFPMLDYRTYFG